MGQALYRTHRPLKLAEVVGQEHVTTALAHALKSGAISHAYLFTGPRGTGKTSIARILAHEINSLPYTDDAAHLDIIEIDAASNRRIDEIRDLRDKVHLAPTSAKYKVYIIDEVHMLTREAFNALLKTLEEPPAHVVFILATTEVHKLPETIISRTQRYAFKPVALPAVVKHLQHIARQEKIEIEPAALELIAEHGEGSFRDSISLLDQVRHTGKKVMLGDVQATLGIPPAELVERLLAALRGHNSAELVTGLQQAREQGYEAAQLAKQIAILLRAQLLKGQNGLEPGITLRLLEKLVDVPVSADPAAFLEISLLDATLSGEVSSQPRGSAAEPKAPTTGEGAPHKPAAQSAQVVAQSPSLHASASRPKPAKPPVKENAATPQSPNPDALQQARPASPTAILDETIWPQILQKVKQKYNTLYSILQAAPADFQPGLIVLKFSHAFHQKRAQDPKNRQVLAETIRELTGQTVEISCQLAEKDEPESKPPQKSTTSPPEVILPKKPTADSLEAISNIFGHAEVLES